MKHDRCECLRISYTCLCIFFKLMNIYTYIDGLENRQWSEIFKFALMVLWFNTHAKIGSKNVMFEKSRIGSEIRSASLNSASIQTYFKVERCMIYIFR